MAKLGEMNALGLGSMYPPGLISYFIEICSASTGLPWAAGIILTTLSIRVVLLPLILKSMRNNVIMANLAPEITLHSERMKKCNKSGDMDGAQDAQQRLMKLFESNNIHPLKGLIPIIIQMPIFISMFMAIRAMAELPVRSYLVYIFQLICRQRSKLIFYNLLTIQFV